MPLKRSPCRMVLYQHRGRIFFKPQGMTFKHMRQAGATYSEPFT